LRWKTISKLYVVFLSATFNSFHEWESKILGVRKIRHRGVSFWIPIDPLHTLLLKSKIMVSRSKTISNLYLLFLSATFYSFHEWEWKILGVLEIRHRGLFLWIPIDSLHTLFLKSKIMFFTLGNHFHLLRTFRVGHFLFIS